MNTTKHDSDWHEVFRDHTITDDSDIARARKRRKQESELDRFIEDKLDTMYTTIEDGKRVSKSFLNEPLRWWRERGEARYPTLAAIAYDTLSIPGMSSECERAFSAAKRMISDERYQLKPDIIEADQCIKSWLRNKVANGAAAFHTISSASSSDSDKQKPLDGGEVGLIELDNDEFG